jgi:glyoxylase-like metal-dependent hydrolase (beta-lactamase superfamily II)
MAAPARAQTRSQGADRLYILQCGEGHSKDQSRWSPGINVGIPIDISDNCYLIHDGANGYFLWDTGVSDFVASMPHGWQNGSILWTKKKTLSAQLAELHVSQDQIHFIGISHTHPDHIGNIEMFPKATVIMQQAEWDSYFGPHGKVQVPPGDTLPPFGREHPTKLLWEDFDVFGNGDITIIATPGHTPGHDSLLVHLKKTGWIILSGDAVHSQGNWDNRRVPFFSPSTDPSESPTVLEKKMETQLSMQRIADLMRFYNAQLWINHDKPSSDRLRKAPGYYD